MENIILNQFEQYYKEYKEFKTFFEENEKQVKATMEEKVRALLAGGNPDPEAATAFAIEHKAMPTLYATDLNNLKERVLVAYDLCKDIDSIPEEVHTELKALKSKQNRLMFVIKHGKAEVVAQDLVDAYLRQLTPEKLNHIIKALDNIVTLNDKMS